MIGRMAATAPIKGAGAAANGAGAASTATAAGGQGVNLVGPTVGVMGAAAGVAAVGVGAATLGIIALTDANRPSNRKAMARDKAAFERNPFGGALVALGILLGVVMIVVGHLAGSPAIEYASFGGGGALMIAGSLMTLHKPGSKGATVKHSHGVELSRDKRVTMILDTPCPKCMTLMGRSCPNTGEAPLIKLGPAQYAHYHRVEFAVKRNPEYRTQIRAQFGDNLPKGLDI